MDQQSVSLVQLVISIIGSGLGTTGVGLLFNRKFGRELEIQKAFLTRASNVHAHTVDALAKLYRHLYEAQELLKRMTSNGRMEGEISPQEYAPLVTKAMESASMELLEGRLFIPSALVQQCDAFFEAVFEGRQNFALAHHPMIDPGKQAEFWAKAATVAYAKVPKIVRQIEEAARVVIHGERP